MQTLAIAAMLCGVDLVTIQVGENGMRSSQKSKATWSVWLPIIIAGASCIGGGVAWLAKEYEARVAQRAVAAKNNETLIAQYLIPAQSDLKRARQLKKYIDKTYQYKGMGILESYVYRARASGGEGSQIELELIRQLNIQANSIRSRLKNYVGCAVTDPYRSASSETIDNLDVYLQHASSIELLAKSTEWLPPYEMFPDQIESALQTEIATRRSTDPLKLSGLECLVQPVG